MRVLLYNGPKIKKSRIIPLSDLGVAKGAMSRMSIFNMRAALLACLQLASAALQCPYMQGRGFELTCPARP